MAYDEFGLTGYTCRNLIRIQLKGGVWNKETYHANETMGMTHDLILAKAFLQ